MRRIRAFTAIAGENLFSRILRSSRRNENDRRRPASILRAGKDGTQERPFPLSRSVDGNRQRKRRRSPAIIEYINDVVALIGRVACTRLLIAEHNAAVA